jgi:hypothetical protein
MLAYLEEADDGPDAVVDRVAEHGGEGPQHHPEVVARQPQLGLQEVQHGQQLLVHVQGEQQREDLDHAPDLPHRYAQRLQQRHPRLEVVLHAAHHHLRVATHEDVDPLQAQLLAQEGRHGPEALHGVAVQQPRVAAVERAQLLGLEAHLLGRQEGRHQEDHRRRNAQQRREAEGRVQHVVGGHAHLLQRRHRLAYAPLCGVHAMHAGSATTTP